MKVRQEAIQYMQGPQGSLEVNVGKIYRQSTARAGPGSYGPNMFIVVDSVSY
jgi:hypothetical protein